MVLSNGQPVTLNAENSWSATVSGLPVYEAGEPIIYTWTEQEVAGYRLAGVATDGSVTTFTNQVIPVPVPPQENRQPRVPTQTLTVIEEYETALGVDVMINHVGDCFD